MWSRRAAFGEQLTGWLPGIDKKSRVVTEQAPSEAKRELCLIFNKELYLLRYKSEEKPRWRHKGGKVKDTINKI